MNYQETITKHLDRSSEGEMRTPEFIVNAMIQQIPLHIFKSETTTFLDPCFGTGSFFAAVVVELRKHGHSDNNIKSRLFGYEISSRLYNKTNRKFRHIIINREDFLKAEINMKFDIVLLNPPYSMGLHATFLNKAFSLLKDKGTLSAVHPSTFIISQKTAVKLRRKDQELNDNIEKYKSRVHLINGNSHFNNAAFFTPLSITTIAKVEDPTINVVYEHQGEYSSKTVTSLSDVWTHGNDLIQSIFHKVKEKMTESLEDNLHRKTNVPKKLYLKAIIIGGHPPTRSMVGSHPDFNCIFYKTDVDSVGYINAITRNPDNKWGNFIGVDSKKQAKNLYSYAVTKFARFCVSMLKINQSMHRGELAMTPYLDFSKEWTDEKCYKYFNLTEEEIEFIEYYIKDWYAHDFINC